MISIRLHDSLLRGIFFLASIACFVFFSIDTASAQAVQSYTNLGLDGGRINALAADPSNPNKLFAASYLGDGLYLTEDGGANWHAVDTGSGLPEERFRNHEVFDVEIARSDSQVVWVAHEQFLAKSTDGGLTWSHIPQSLMQSTDNRACRSISIDPVNANIVYVGTSGIDLSWVAGAVFKTTDGGVNWTKLQPATGQDFDYAVWDVEVAPSDPSRIYAVTNSYEWIDGWWYGGKLYASRDAGSTWEVVVDGAAWWRGFYDVTVKPDDPNIVITGDDFNFVLYRDTTGTGVWAPEYYLSKWGYGGYLGRDAVFDSGNPDILYGVWYDSFGNVSGGVPTGYVSRFDLTLLDPVNPIQGQTETVIDSGDFDYLSVAMSPDGSAIFAGDSARGVVKSNDSGLSWTRSNKGLNAVIVYDVETDPRDHAHLLAATIHGVYERQGGLEWQRLLSDTVYSVSFDPVVDSVFYAGGKARFYKSVDSGQNWTETEIWGRPLDAAIRVVDIEVDPGNTDRIFIAVQADVLANGQIHRSLDGGASFTSGTALSEPVLDSNESGRDYPFNVVIIDPADPNHVYAGGGALHGNQAPGDLWESTLGGDTGTWTMTGLQNVVVNALLVDPADPTVLYAGAGHSSGTEVPLYKSTDAGQSWSPFYTGMPGGTGELLNAVTDLGFSRASSDHVYAATWSRGVYVSPYNGRLWLNLGTPDYAVHAIATGSLYAGTEGGLYQLTGTGCIYGLVQDASDQSDINGATVFTEYTQGLSINGEYLMISPAGTFDVKSIASGYSDATAYGVAVNGGDVTEADFSMTAGTGSASPAGAPQLIYPENNGIVYGDAVTFKWRISADSGRGIGQFLYYTDKSDFSGEVPVQVAWSGSSGGVLLAGSISIFLAIGMVFAGPERGRKGIFLLMLVIGVSVLTAVSCTGSGNSRNFNSEQLVERAVTGLEPGVTYYWKVRLDDGNGNQVESEVRNFRVEAGPAPATAAAGDAGKIGIILKTGN